MVVCQQPRKQKIHAAHKCVIYWYRKVAKFNLQKYSADFDQIYIYTFYLTYTLLHISKLKEITSVLLEIFVPEYCPIFFTFFFFFAKNYKYI